VGHPRPGKLILMGRRPTATCTLSLPTLPGSHPDWTWPTAFDHKYW